MSNFIALIVACVVFSCQVFVEGKWECSGCNIQYKAVGCYRDHFKRPLPNQILNERDPSSLVYGGRKIDWWDWNNYIAGFACRCATVAKSKGHSVFGLQFYGECWSGPDPNSYRSVGLASDDDCVGPDYKTCSKYDRHCVGKKEINFVYKIVSDCDIPLETVGCYRDRHIKDARPLPLYIMTDRDKSIKQYSGQSIDWRNWDVYMPELVCRCARKAKEMGKTTFGIQYYGECWAADDSNTLYGKDGTTSTCINKCYGDCKSYDKYCSGKQHTNFVYRLGDTPCEWKTTPVGCYKEETSSRALDIKLLDEMAPGPAMDAFRGNVFDTANWSAEFPKLLCRCARAARNRGLSVFGIHNTGTCWGSKDSNAYKKHGESSKCIKDTGACPSNSANCAGNEESIFVYTVSENAPALKSRSIQSILGL